MDLLITVSNSRSAEYLEPLLRACIRKECNWRVFLTHKGVQALVNPDIAGLLQSHRDNAVVCHDSWQQFGPDEDCPVTVGSQTNHSQFAGLAQRVVSL